VRPGIFRREFQNLPFSFVDHSAMTTKCSVDFKLTLLDVVLGCARCFPFVFMRCVQCGSLKDKVLDSRSSKDGTTIRRRRECIKCTYRYTTYEQIERTELRVVKRDGAREALNREKLMSGLIKACEKRPVPMDRLDRAVEEILTDLHKDHLSEVPSAIIGGKVMDKLHQIDPVAYVRYVSVYRQFEDVNEFIAEIQSLSRRAARDPFQRRLFKD
jgi:transcriptional repressor NrdR